MQIINHMKLRHPHIIALREVFLTSTHLVLVMEYAAGGDLFRYVSARKGLRDDEARWFFQQLIIAVDYCHRMVSMVGVALLCSAVRCRVVSFTVWMLCCCVVAHIAHRVAAVSACRA